MNGEFQVRLGSEQPGVDVAGLDHRLQLAPALDVLVTEEELRDKVDLFIAALIHLARILGVNEAFSLTIPFDGVGREGHAATS